MSLPLIFERSRCRLWPIHLNIETLRLAKTEVEVNSEKKAVNVFEMKVMPTMKNIVYSVYIRFTASGEYVSKLSKCDCQNVIVQMGGYSAATLLLVFRSSILPRQKMVGLLKK